MAVIKGADRHSRRLRNMRGIKTVEKIGQGVFTLADIGRVEAQLSITKGSVSGKNHVASAPGEAPNRDTSELDQSIIAYKTGPVSAVYSANTPYAAAQEFGHTYDDGRVLAERPYMRPSADKVRARIKDVMGNVVKAIIRES